MRLLTVETQGLLFDMDGVLISSTGSVVRCWQRWCKLYGVPNAAQFRCRMERARWTLCAC